MTEWLTNNDVQVKKDEERLKKRGALYPQLIDVAEESGDEYWDWEDGSRTHAKAVMDILDEARQEFPMDSDEEVKGLLFSERNILLSTARLKWFRKWFGV